MALIRDFWFAWRNFGLMTAAFMAARYLFGIEDIKAMRLREMRKALDWPLSPELVDRHLKFRSANLLKVPVPRTVHWIIPPIAASSGGHRTIMRMVTHLLKRGFENTIWINGGRRNSDDAGELLKIFGVAGARVAHLESPDQISADVLIATDRWTAYPAAMAERVLKKYYLIQDYEPMFYEAGSLSVLADFTYKLGMHPITAGKWIQRTLKHHHGIDADSFDLAVDHEIYKTVGRMDPKVPTLVFYARDNTPRRCVELGLLALGELKRNMPDVRIILFGYANKVFKIDFEAETYGIIPPKQIAELYKRSSIGLSLSATNYSLIPNEMMACGLPVVELNLQNNACVYPKNTVYLAEPHPINIFQSLQLLITDHKLRSQLRDRALKHAQGLSWTRSAEKLEAIILRNFRE